MYLNKWSRRVEKAQNLEETMGVIYTSDLHGNVEHYCQLRE